MRAASVPTPRTRGRRWMAIRSSILSRDPLCVECLKQDRVTASQEVDHIVPLSRGGTDDEENLQGLCVDCHKVKSAGPAAKPVIGLDGWPQRPQDTRSVTRVPLHTSVDHRGSYSRVGGGLEKSAATTGKPGALLCVGEANSTSGKF